MHNLEPTPPSHTQLPAQEFIPQVDNSGEFSLVMPALPLEKPAQSIGLNEITPTETRLPGEIAAFKTLTEIDSRMQVDGFPEMEQIWSRFKRSGIQLETLDAEAISLRRQRHMAPLFGRPLAAAAGLVAAGLSSAYWMSSNVITFFSDISPASRAALTALTAVNGGIVATYAATLFQRYVSHPLHRLMASDLACQLREPNFRQWLENTPRAKAAIAELRARGINEKWDNPEYRARYSASNDGVERLNLEKHHEFVQRVLREFLGYKDAERRKFVEGVYTHDLIEQKGSVTKFINRFQADVAANRQGSLAKESGLALLQTLRAEYVKPGSNGDKVLVEYIAGIESGDYLSGNVIEAKVWARDPWRDLTHQEEFYSSASLRGVKLMGRGPKGRLGPFSYMHNTCISALDFSTKKGRIVRARCAAAVSVPIDSKATPETILFVDGIEGSNALKPGVALRAIEEYASASGFDAVIYNKFVHNQTPKRFIDCVAARGVPIEQVKIRFIDDTHREYIDALGVPIEPFEYSYPRGMIVGYRVDLNSPRTSPLEPPTKLTKAVQFLRCNSLWLLLAESQIFTVAMLWHSTPKVLIPWAAILAGATYAHVKFQNRSVRDRG